MADLTDAELDGLVAYWEAANYLTVAQIYLQDNALLREPLRPEHIKPRLLGHWGTSPGLNLVYAQLNRLIRETGPSTKGRATLVSTGVTSPSQSAESHGVISGTDSLRGGALPSASAIRSSMSA